jgi:hypothetical protein
MAAAVPASLLALGLWLCFRQLRTCRRMGLGQLSAMTGREQVQQRSAFPPHTTLASKRLASPTFPGWIAPALLGAFHSLDHLVGYELHLRWYIQPQRVRCFHVDRQLKLRRCLHWQIGRLCTFENTVNVRSCATK